MRAPEYDRAELVPAVVHIGVGGFHRSHQAVYFDDLAERNPVQPWGITGVSLRSRRVKDALDPQDCLFTVLERGAKGDTARVVGAVSRCLFAPQQRAAVLAALTDERTRLVTLTVTGNGYNIDPSTGAFDFSAAVAAAELRDPTRPATVHGYLVEALARRRAAGTPPFTVLSCDNMPGNGRVARAALVSFARRRDASLASWIERRVAFPSSMVDRITPTTAAQHRRLIANRFGVHDRCPVVAEPFSQWIVENDFCNERPPLEDVGVQFVADVTPYQVVKNRMLNAGHSALGYLGILAGYERTDDAMGDPLLAGYLRAMLDVEIAPLLSAAQGLDLVDYRRTLLRRFANPAIGDPLARLCGRGSTKMPAYVLPSIIDARRRGRPHALLTLAVAAWFRFLQGRDDRGRRLELKDDLAHELRPLALAGGCDPRPLLARRSLFAHLGDDPEFVSCLRRTLVALERRGVSVAVASQLCGEQALAA